MIIVIESIVLCGLFTLMVYLLSREPIKTLYNYPPRIIERVKSLEEYKDKIPTNKDKLVKKLTAVVVIATLFALILRYVNGYTGFVQSFKYAFLLWSIVNAYDALIMDIVWFCHDPHFVFKGTEDMVSDYHDYWFHIKQSLIGELIGLFVCALTAGIVQLLP